MRRDNPDEDDMPSVFQAWARRAEETRMGATAYRPAQEAPAARSTPAPTASPRRQTNNERLCADFRTLLTTGFYVIDADGVIAEGDSRLSALSATKPWRNDLWRKFRELEDRLCPVKAHEEGRA
jgi:hypothetical protein